MTLGEVEKLTLTQEVKDKGLTEELARIMLGRVPLEIDSRGDWASKPRLGSEVKVSHYSPRIPEENTLNHIGLKVDSSKYEEGYELITITPFDKKTWRIVIPTNPSEAYCFHNKRYKDWISVNFVNFKQNAP